MNLGSQLYVAVTFFFAMVASFYPSTLSIGMRHFGTNMFVINSTSNYFVLKSWKFGNHFVLLNLFALGDYPIIFKAILTKIGVKST
jgi:hypothetical protein